MTYRPTESVYGPPFAKRIPSLIYLALALLFGLFIAFAESSPTDSWQFVYVVERDVHRPLGSRPFAIILVLSALAAVVRTSMRGVRVRPDGVECREVVGLGWPRIQRYRWPQIDGIDLATRSIAFDLWDGTRTFLPVVSDREGLAVVLEKIGAARSIPVKGGQGLDEVPESHEFDDED